MEEPSLAAEQFASIRKESFKTVLVTEKKIQILLQRKTTKIFFCQKVWIQLRCSSIEILLESKFTWFKFSGEKKSSLFMPESEDVFTHFRHSMRDLVSLKIRDSSHS